MALNRYWIEIIWVFIVGLLSHQFFHKEPVEINGITTEKWSWIHSVFLALPYVYFTGTRSNVFGDTIVYARNFTNAPGKFADIPVYITHLTKDKGFYTFMALIKCIFGDHVEVFFFIVAGIQMYAVVRLFRNHSNNFWFSFFVFIAATDYLAWMHNGIRQFLAATLVYLGTDWLLEKKYVRLLLLIAFASLFHQSVLLMVPFFIVIQGKAWNTRTLLAILLCIVAVAFVVRFTNLLDLALESTQYSNVVSDWKEFRDDGTNPLRVLVYSIPAIIAIIGYRWVWDIRDSMINICVNASFLVAGLYLVSMVTSGIFIGRIPIYLSLYSNGILLPWEIEMLFEKKSAGFVRGSAIILYCIFFYYQMHITWGLI